MEVSNDNVCSISSPRTPISTCPEMSSLMSHSFSRESIISCLTNTEQHGGLGCTPSKDYASLEVTIEKCEEATAADHEKQEKFQQFNDLTTAMKKQRLSLPNLVTNTISNKRGSTETVPESDEYESAEEQVAHDNFYVDSLVSPALSAFDSSTPVENPGWNTFLETSAVFFPGSSVPLDATVKGVAMPRGDSIDCHPVTTSTPAMEETAPAISTLAVLTDKTDPIIALQDFTKIGIRNSQPFSPSSDSETENSVVDPVEETILVPVETQPTSEVEVDLASQFEKLVLTKQSSAEENQAILKTTFPAEESENSRALLNEAVSLEVELNAHLINHTISIEQRAESGEQSLDRTIPLEAEAMAPSQGAANDEPVDKPSTVAKLGNASFPVDDLKPPVSTVEPEPATCEPFNEEEQSREKYEVFPDFEKKLAKQQSSETFSCLSPSSEVAAASPSADITRAVADALTVESSSQCNQGNEEKLKPCSLPEDKPIVPKKGYDLSFLDKFENLENATPSFSQAKFPIPFPEADTQSTSVKEDNKEAGATINSIETETEQGPASILNSTFEAKSFAEETTELSQQKDNDASSGKLEKETLAKDEVSVAPMKHAAIAPTSEPTNPAVDEPNLESGKEDKPSDGKALENEHANRQLHRARFQRPVVPATKTNAFEMEFKFDPNDDPFKPKTRLCSSPQKGETPTSAFAQSAFEENFPSLETNSTMNATDASNEGNTTVIDTLAEKPPEKDSASSKVTSENEQPLHEEEFRPAQEVFRDPSDLDFLMQHGGSSQEIALARQSLFLKFDPLIGGRPSLFPSMQSNGSLGGGDETVVMEEQSAGRKSTGESLFLFSPPHSSGASGAKMERKLISSAADCFSSLTPVIADDVIGLHEHREALQRHELLFQDKILQKDREILTKEKQNRELRAELEAAVEAKTRINQTLVDYEKTISQLIADKEREKANMEATIQNTIKERDQAIEDLKEVERAFSEFHRMYERNRAAAERLQQNEQVLKKSLDAYKERLQHEQQKFEALKLRSAEKLEKALQEMENMKRTLEGESSQLKAQLKKTEMRLASTEASIEQKSRENQELTKLCDELISKMGSGTK